MTQKDRIYNSFISHELLSTKYKLQFDTLPKSVHEAKKSDIPIIKAIALIVEGLEKSPSSNDSELRRIVLSHLNESI